MASSIGIKIANGEFYPLVEENSLVKKRLILTTAHDNQSSVQIDLYRSDAKIMEEAQYIGTLVVENIKPRPKGEPSIEMVISSNSNGEIIADAIDLDAGHKSEHNVLTVSLRSVDETSQDVEIPDFDLESSEDPPLGLYNHAKNIRKEKQRKSLAWLFVLILLIILLGLAGVWLFFFGGLDIVQEKWPDVQRTLKERVIEPAKQLGDKASQLFSKGNSVAPVAITVVSEPAPVQQTAEPAPVVESPAPRTEVVQTSAGPPAYNVPAIIPREGVNYRIRWGDTLWDISETFYRNPYLYPRIPRHNNIPNPNYIISGRIIRIPPKN
jgi:hypothetical protein